VEVDDSRQHLGDAAGIWAAATAARNGESQTAHNSLPERRRDRRSDRMKPMSATPTTTPMMIWTTWVPEPPTMPATVCSSEARA
jgi:hypothetical protein